MAFKDNYLLLKTTVPFKIYQQEKGTWPVLVASPRYEREELIQKWKKAEIIIFTSKSAFLSIKEEMLPENILLIGATGDQTISLIEREKKWPSVSLLGLEKRGFSELLDKIDQDKNILIITSYGGVTHSILEKKGLDKVEHITSFPVYHVEPTGISFSEIIAPFLFLSQKQEDRQNLLFSLTRPYFSYDFIIVECHSGKVVKEVYHQLNDFFSFKKEKIADFIRFRCEKETAKQAIRDLGLEKMLI